METIPTIIITHPDRMEAATQLADQTNGILSLDAHGMGAGRAHEAALETAGRLEAHKWTLLLEDDAILCDDWHNQIQAALESAPTNIVSLYLGTGYPQAKQADIKKLATTDTNYIISNTLRHHVAVAVKAHLIPRLVQALQKFGGAPDNRLGDAAASLGETIAYTNPSIVDHQDDTPIITGRVRSLPRKAHNFGTRTQWDSNATKNL